jgi:CheY-like chemotaxis protein/thioredoxin-like negative regulator of GroEL
MDASDRNLTLMIVDDQMVVRKMIRDMLRKIGYQNFIMADDGDSALVKLRTNHVDLLLCDWNMPRMTGVEVLHQVRADEALKDLPFIMVTGEVDETTVAEAIEGEVDAYLLKPFTSDALQKKIEEVLEKRRQPSPTDIHINLGQVYLKGRQYDQALGEFFKAQDLNPKSARPLTCIGQAYEEKGELDTARQYYQKAVSLVPKFIKAQDSLARVHLAQGKPELAAKHLQAAVAISPRNIQRQLNLGQALLQAGRPEEARRVLSGITRHVEPKERPEVARQVGETLLEAGLDEDAQLAFQEGIESDPDDIHLYNRLGIAFRKQGKTREAIDNYRRALQIDPENEILLYNLARAYHEGGDLDLAGAAMKRALAINSEFEEAQEFLVKVLKIPLPRT